MIKNLIRRTSVLRLRTHIIAVLLIENEASNQSDLIIMIPKSKNRKPETV